jgi:cAMP phosphodiesterase
MDSSNDDDFLFIFLYKRYFYRIAIEKRSLPLQTDVQGFLQDQIKAYLISHGHLDHISGFILNTPNDKSGKFIIGLNQTINIIRKSYFNNQAWADFGPTGLKVI